MDAPIAFAIGCVAGARRLAYKRRDSDDPAAVAGGLPQLLGGPHRQGEVVQRLEFATIITRGGEPYSIVEGDSAKQARAHYLSAEVPQAKGLVVGAGGGGTTTRSRTRSGLPSAR